MKAATRFLVLMLAAPALGGESSPAPRAKDAFDAPVRLKAGDAYVDTGKYIAHTGPLVYDYDGDGKPDLLVGNFMGNVQVFRNTGTRESPVYEAKGLLQADGKDVKIPNW
jgi:hypothetical protein